MVLYVKPDNAPTVTSAVVRLEPVMSNEFGPASLLIQALPKEVNGERIDRDGVATEEALKRSRHLQM